MLHGSFESRKTAQYSFRPLSNSMFGIVYLNFMLFKSSRSLGDLKSSRRQGI